MPGNCADVIYMENPDGTTDFLSSTLTHREKGTKANRGEHYSTTLLKNANCDAPDIQISIMTTEFRAIVHQAWLDANQRLFPADYCFATGYYQPQPQAVPVLPETDSTWSITILVRLRETQEPAALRLGDYLRAFRDTLVQRFEESPLVVFPEQFWVVVINPLSNDRAKSQEARPPVEAAFEKLCFPLRESP